MMDLFTYPTSPGFKARQTSSAAAESMRPKAAILRERIVDLLTPALQLTADEAADILGESVLSIRPRFSELANLGRIVATDLRRANASGRSAIVWRLP